MATIIAYTILVYAQDHMRWAIGVCPQKNQWLPSHDSRDFQECNVQAFAMSGMQCSNLTNMHQWESSLMHAIENTS